jgi:hypothetical protein
MTLSITTLDHNKGQATSFTTASVNSSPTGSLIVLMMITTGSAGIPSPSGLGITWTLRTSIVQANIQLFGWSGVSVGNTGTVTVTYTGGSLAFCYEIVQVSGTGPAYISSATSNANNVASPNSLTPSVVPPAYAYGLVGLWGSNSPSGVVPTWTGDAGPPTWTQGTTQTQGTTPNYNATMQWATTGDSTPTGTWTYASGTASTVAGVMIIAEPPVVDDPIPQQHKPALIAPILAQ